MNHIPILTYLAQVQNFNQSPTKTALVLPLNFALMALPFLPIANMIKPMLWCKGVVIVGIVPGVDYNAQNRNMGALLKASALWRNPEMKRIYSRRYISSQSPVEGEK